MSVLSHLTLIAQQSIISDKEQLAIYNSIVTLQKRLTASFPGGIQYQTLFGSFARGTILPRKFDSESDVDYMVVFNNNSLQPQTYLDQLRRFVEGSYSRSEIKQAHPTIQLELNHIRFELVPAINSDWFGYQIPVKTSLYSSWQSTNPIGFNSQLITANQSNRELIKPMIRVLKYWNVNNGRPFDSYELEKAIVEYANQLFAFSGCLNLWNFVHCFVTNYRPNFGAQWKRERWIRLQDAVNKARNYEANGYPIHAETEIKKVIPALVGLGIR